MTVHDFKLFRELLYRYQAVSFIEAVTVLTHSSSSRRVFFGFEIKGDGLSWNLTISPCLRMIESL